MSSISYPQSTAPQNETDPDLGHELNTGADGIALTEPHKEPSNSLWRLRAYCAVLLLAPFVYMAVCFVLMRSNRILTHTQNTYIANMGYGMRLKNADCKVLIYGDSTALIGLDPATLKRATGLSTCNIAEYAGILQLNGTMVLDRFLAQNPRPEYLVFLMSPEDLAPTWRHDDNYEAVLMRVRERPDVGLLYAIMRHGDDILSALGVTGRFAFTDMVRRPLPESVYHERDRTGGRFPDPTARLTACFADVRINPPSRGWVDALRTRYGVQGTHVIVDVVPVPSCDPGLATYQREFAPGNGIIDNRLEIYPINWYTHSGRLHLGSPEGWGHLSTEVAGQIEQTQKAGGAR